MENNLNKLKLEELDNLFWSKVKEGYIINPELDFNGFKGRITKSKIIWSINNMVKKETIQKLDHTQEFLNTLTHQEKVNLAFQLMDYISEKMYVSGDTITIVTNEYSTEE